MIFLLLSIVFMTALALCLAGGARRGLNVLGLNLVFRTTGGVLGLVGLLAWQTTNDFPAVWSRVGGIALVGGFCYWLSGVATIQAVQRGHLGVTWTVTRCAMVLPTLASIMVWHEISLWPVSPLLLLRMAGLALTVVAAVLLGMDRLRPHPGDRSQSASRAWIAWLATAFCAQGAWEITLRASGALREESARGVFIASVFMTAMVLSLALWGIRRPKLGRGELVFGGLAGICGFFGSGLRPWALRDLPGVVVFPVTAAAVMILVQVGGDVLFGHRLSFWGRAALAVAIAAIVLLTM